MELKLSHFPRLLERTKRFNDPLYEMAWYIKMGKALPVTYPYAVGFNSTNIHENVI